LEEFREWWQTIAKFPATEKQWNLDFLIMAVIRTKAKIMNLLQEVGLAKNRSITELV
jgi:hypothetical protein